jgi:hypothetical protein
MRWINEGNEMKFFSLQRDVKYKDDKGNLGKKHRVFTLYNIRTGTVFCELKMYDDRYGIQVLDFFEPIKNEMYDLIMRDLVADEAYSYDRLILPFFREIKLKELGI